jgi:large subunit ribosomal protein L18
MARTNPKAVSRAKRKVHVRKTLAGTTERPRLSVFRSANHIYAQIIDDSTGHTLVAASSLSEDAKKADTRGSNRDGAKTVGKLIGEKALAANITTVVFDRNGYRYHGRIAALADAAREAGLQF